MIDARIICDSINEKGNRLTTFVVVFPRFILAEVNTHRMLSRNSSSSRAIPVRKMLSSVVFEPAAPMYWGKNQKGMSAYVEMTGLRLLLAKLVWRLSSLNQAFYAWLLYMLGLHKQSTNRLIEPFIHSTVIISATNWDNFFALRTKRDAQPEFRELAIRMLKEYSISTPKRVNDGEYHLPFVGSGEGHLPDDTKIKVSVARCARVSYLNHEGSIDYSKDVDLHDRLLREGHFSPFEHVAVACSDSVQSGNMIGFKQYRKIVGQDEKRLLDVEIQRLVQEG
jgi:hypothetical protein